MHEQLPLSTVTAPQSVGKMTGLEEGIYASSISVDVGTRETDHGLTQPPKIQSQDAEHAKDSRQIIGDGFKDTFKACHPSRPKIDIGTCWSNPILINGEAQPNDHHLAKRRKLAVNDSSYNSQGYEPGSESEIRSPWSASSIDAVIDVGEWQPLVGKDNVPPISPHGTPSSAGQEISHVNRSSDDILSRVNMKKDFKKETSPIERLVPTEGRVVRSSFISSHIVVEEGMHNVAVFNQAPHPTTECEEPNQAKTKPSRFGIDSDLTPRDRNVLLQPVEKEVQVLKGLASIARSTKKSLPSRPSRAAAVAYGVSRGLLEHNLDDSKRGPLWLANHVFRNARTQCDSSQAPPVFSKHSSVVTTRDSKLQESFAAEPARIIAQDHTIPSNLRVQFDALVKKYHQDVLFQKSVDRYIMEISGSLNLSDPDTTRIMEEASPDNLEGKSLEELKAMYKRLDARFKSLSKVAADMAAERIQSRDEIKYLKSMCKKIPDVEVRSSVKMKIKKPSDEMWVCNLDSKGGKPCGRKNSFYRQAIIWIKKKTCSGCRGHINNIRGGFQYTKLAEVIDAHGLSDTGEDGYEDGSPLTSTVPQESAPANPPSHGDPFLEMNAATSRLSGDKCELANPALPNLNFQHTGPSQRPSTTPTRQRFGPGVLETTPTPAPQSSRRSSATPGSASRDSTYGHTDASTFIRDARSRVDPTMPMFYDKRGMECLRAGLATSTSLVEREDVQLSKLPDTSVMVQADKSSAPIGPSAKATKPTSAAIKNSALAKTTTKNTAQVNTSSEKIVPKTASTKRKASANGRSKKVSPKKQLTEAQRLMIETTNSVSEHFSGRQRKAWEGPTKHTVPKNTIEISSDSESNDSCDTDSLFGSNGEREATHVDSVEQVESNAVESDAVDSEEALGELEEEIRAAFERDEPIGSPDDQANRYHEERDCAVNRPSFITNYRRETENIEDHNQLRTNTSSSPLLNKRSAGGEESDESEED